MLRHLDEAQKRYLSHGVTTAAEGLMKQPELNFWTMRPNAARLKPLDVVATPISGTASLPAAPGPLLCRARFRPGG